MSLTKPAPVFKTVSLAVAILFGATSAYAQNNDSRIISAGSAITEIINALDASNQLVAVDSTSQTLVDTKMPKVGYHRQLSAENLMSLTPTRIIGSNEMGPESTLTILKQAGVAVDIVNSGNTVSDLTKRIEQVAQLTGHQKQANKLEQTVQHTVQTLTDHRTQLKKQPNFKEKKVLFVMIHDGRPVNVAGKGTTADTVINLAGAINPAATFVENYKPISTEAMLQMQPDIILLSSRTAATIKTMPDLIKKIPVLAQTPAAQNNALAVIDGTALIGGLGIHSLNEAARLSNVFYPTVNQ
ncbi:TPA: heme/hemin ABC transporter substrate-binding protein [Photobacterium damselae]